MKPQSSSMRMLYRGNDNKKPRLTKAEKVYAALAKDRRKIAADTLAKANA